MSAANPVAAPAPPVQTASVEVLKRIKATETEWSTKLDAARHDAEESLTRVRSERDAAIHAAQQSAEGDRAQAIQVARAEVERDVAEILKDGWRAAETAGRPDGKRPSDHRDAVIAAVLGPFVGR